MRSDMNEFVCCMFSGALYSVFIELPSQLWVMENCMDVVARQLLLLYIALSTPESMSKQGGCGVLYMSNDI